MTYAGLLKCLAMGISGVGAIYLTASGAIAPEAGVGILGAIVGFAVGEQNGYRMAEVKE